MTGPDISVVIPTFNRSRLLARLLDAVPGDDPGRCSIEVIVVDDGSTDDTATVVGRCTRPVQYLRQDGLGPAAARNAGWRASTAPIVVFLDDDCVPRPGWPADYLVTFEDAGVGGVGGTIEPLVPGFVADFITADGLVDHGRPVGGDADADPTYLVTANAAFRRTALEAADGFEEAYRLDRPGRSGRIVAAEDVDLAWRIVEAGWTLKRSPGATVAHDHRVALDDLMRTYFRHGRARRELGRRHRGRGATAGMRRAASTSHWVDRIRRYRDGGTRPWRRVVGFTGLRTGALVAYGSGVLWSFIDDRRAR
jgi:glycosyltransferase involved in cell wall biosynthesis